jgi:hypothetical protein
MPIFHDQDESPGSGKRTSSCQDRTKNTQMHSGRYLFSAPDARVATQQSAPGEHTRPVSRGELIERLKRRQSPPWVTSQQVR